MVRIFWFVSRVAVALIAVTILVDTSAYARDEAGARPAVDDLAKVLMQSRDARLRRLTSRFEWAGTWNPNVSAAWDHRAASGEITLRSGERSALARRLSNLALTKPSMRFGFDTYGPEDCDFLLLIRGREGSNEILLSFPELEARWTGPDSTVRTASFKDQAAQLISILRTCFPSDSGVQDLPAVFGWVIRGPRQSAEGDGSITVDEGLPGVVSEAPCAQPERSGHGVDGTVLLEVLLNRRGSVKAVRVKRSIPMLDALAVACVKRWRFRPGEFNGYPLAFRVTLPIRYVIE